MPVPASSTESCKAPSAVSQHIALCMTHTNAAITQMMSCATVTPFLLVQEAGPCTGHGLHSRDEGEELRLPASIMGQNPPVTEEACAAVLPAATCAAQISKSVAGLLRVRELWRRPHLLPGRWACPVHEYRNLPAKLRSSLAGCWCAGGRADPPVCAEAWRACTGGRRPPWCHQCAAWRRPRGGRSCGQARWHRQGARHTAASIPVLTSALAAFASPCSAPRVLENMTWRCF